MFIVVPCRVSLSAVFSRTRLFIGYILANRLFRVVSQLGLFSLFPRSIARNNQPLHLNIYIVCSPRTLLALALIYMSLLPMYGILSTCSTYFALILLPTYALYRQRAVVVYMHYIHAPYISNKQCWKALTKTTPVVTFR